MDPQRGDKRVALSVLSIYYTGKNIKKLYRNNEIHLKYQEQYGMKRLNCLMDLILCQVFRTISNTSSKSIKY